MIAIFGIFFVAANTSVSVESGKVGKGGRKGRAGVVLIKKFNTADPKKEKIVRIAYVLQRIWINLLIAMDY